MSGRYKAIPETTYKRNPVYVVIDTLTGEWMHVYDCFMWAEKKAKEMNGLYENGGEQYGEDPRYFSNV